MPSCALRRQCVPQGPSSAASLEQIVSQLVEARLARAAALAAVPPPPPPRMVEEARLACTPPPLVRSPPRVGVACGGGVSSALAGLVVGVLVGVCFERMRRKRRPATSPAPPPPPLKPLSMAEAKAAAEEAKEGRGGRKEAKVGAAPLGFAGFDATRLMLSPSPAASSTRGEEAEWGHFQSSDAVGEGLVASGECQVDGTMIGARLSAHDASHMRTPSATTWNERGAVGKDSLSDLWEAVKKEPVKSPVTTRLG
ncbi:hypothetical protein AB1Y20_012088 [Prymnesium parvum]|uniref:Uncharacterized protein n=1 Tax=Prymnesium parvum TaxID=97485 RepID=A0AB34IMG5_PRYPA